MPRVAGGEDERLDDAATIGLRVEEQAHLAEVDLALCPRLTVGDPDGRHARAAPVTKDLKHVAVQRPLGNDDAAAREQLMDLPDGEAVLDEALDLVVVGDDECPGRPMAVTAVRADRLADPGNQLVGELALTA